MLRGLCGMFFLFWGIVTSSAQEDVIKEEFDSGVKLLKEEQYSKAIIHFTSVIELSNIPKVSKMAHVYRGFCYQGMSQVDKAIKDFTRAIAIDSTDLASYIDRGKAYLSINDYKKATNDFVHVISVNTQSKAAYYYLGRITYDQGNFEQSVQYYDKLIELSPSDYEAFFNRACAKGMLMDISGSINDYDEAIRLKQDFKEAYTNRGVQKINALTQNGNISPSKGETKSACLDFQKAMELGDDTVDVYLIHCTDFIDKMNKSQK